MTRRLESLRQIFDENPALFSDQFATYCLPGREPHYNASLPEYIEAAYWISPPVQKVLLDFSRHGGIDDNYLSLDKVKNAYYYFLHPLLEMTKFAEHLEIPEMNLRNQFRKTLKVMNPDPETYNDPVFAKQNALVRAVMLYRQLDPQLITTKSKTSLVVSQ